jgi:hypothetical protein
MGPAYPRPATRLGKIRDRVIILRLFEPGVASVMVGFGVFRVESNNLGEVSDGSAVFSLGGPGVATIEVSFVRRGQSAGLL